MCTYRCKYFKAKAVTIKAVTSFDILFTVMPCLAFTLLYVLFMLDDLLVTFPRSALSSMSMRWSDRLPSSAVRRRCAAFARMSSGRRRSSANSALASSPTATMSSASSASASGAQRNTLKTRSSGRSQSQLSTSS